MKPYLAAALALAVLVGACTDPSLPSSTGGGGGSDAGGGAPTGGGAEGGGGAAPVPWSWDLPTGFPPPKVPNDNPMSFAKAELGRHLFYDERLSGNETQSCASCHEQALAFTDGKAHAEGSTGDIHPRSSMSLANVGYSSVLTWANQDLRLLEPQAEVPIFGTAPVELGMAGLESELEARIAADARYPAMFAEAFPEEEGAITIATITKALACFQRTLISGRSAFDRYEFEADASGMSDAALRGLDLFISGRLGCFRCHQGFALQDAIVTADQMFPVIRFHNTGLYNIGGTGSYPEGGRGLYETTGVASDMGKFRAPGLRNIAVTGPYMHDGSVATLDEVLDHYAAGGRTIEEGEFAGDGSQNPFKSQLVRAFTLTPGERADMHAFFESLTDEEFLTNPAFADPGSTAAP